MKQINVCVIGYGQRGRWAVSELMGHGDVSITAVCDRYADRAEEAAQAVLRAEKRRRPRIRTTA